MTDHKFELSFGTAAKNSKYDSKQFTLAELEELFGFHRPQKKKDGLCFIPGPLLGGVRIKTSVPKIYCLVYDIDGTDSFAALDKKLDELGYRAFLYTTYSHKTSVTKVKTDAYEKWSKKANASSKPNANTMALYLVSVGKDYLTNIKCDGKFEQEADGMFYYVHHDPVDKMRVIFPLEKPIVLANLSHLTTEAGNIYKAIYHGVGNSLGLKFDAACSDPSRLHFVPAHPETAKDGDFLSYSYPGNLLDFEQFERAALKTQGTKTKSDGSERKESPIDYIVYDRDDRYIDLLTWDRAHYATFDIEEMLTRVLPEEMLREQRAAGGFHIECPFEEGHTAPGGTGTFIANGDGERGWTIYCSHNSCLNLGERRKLDYLKKLIQDGHIRAVDLGYAEASPAAAEPAPTPDMSLLGIDPDTLPAISAEEFNDTLLEAKAFTSKTQALEEARKIIEEAQFTGHVAQGLKYLEDADIQLDGTTLVEMVGKSQCSVHSVEDYLKKNKKLIGGMNGNEFGDALREYRSQAISLAQKLGEILGEDKAGLDLENELRKLSLWYGIAETKSKAHVAEMRRETDLMLMDENVVAQVAQLEKRYAKITVGQNMSWLDVIETKVNANGKPAMRSPQAMANLKKNYNVLVVTDPKKGQGKSVNIWETYIETCKTIPEYAGTTFDPRRDPDDQRNGEAFNVWTGFKFKARPGDITPIRDHILNIWCKGDETVYNWIQLYLADIIQHPGEKPHAAVAILGGAGTGKSIVLEAFCRIVNPWSFTTARAEDIVGRFNSQVANKLVVVSEEAIFSGNKLAMARLKQTISGRTTPMESKGIDTQDMPNFTRYFFISNERHALHLDDDDRRFLVIRTAPKQDPEYYIKLAAWLKDDRNLAAWAHHLSTFKPEDHGLSWGSLHHVPMTDEKIEQIEQSQDAGTQFFLDLMTHGRLSRLPHAVDLPMKVSWPLDEPLTVERSLFRQSYEAYVRHFSGKPEYEVMKYSPTAKQYLGALTQYRATVRDQQGEVKAAYKFPARRGVIADAIARKAVRVSVLEEAVENPKSHLPQYNED